MLNELQNNLSRAIVRQIWERGYHVTIHRVNDTVELHAIKLPDGDDVQIARSNAGDGPEEAVCILARAVGVVLKR